MFIRQKSLHLFSNYNTEYKNDRMSAIQKKKNFISFEKKLLLECMIEYKNIIENKKTDGSSIKTKQKAD